jgi:hypothetical protein
MIGVDDDSLIIEDDDPIMEDEGQYTNRNKLNIPKTMIEREPEREPDNSVLEGNVSHSMIENEKGVA